MPRTSTRKLANQTSIRDLSAGVQDSGQSLFSSIAGFRHLFLDDTEPLAHKKLYLLAFQLCFFLENRINFLISQIKKTRNVKFMHNEIYYYVSLHSSQSARTCTSVATARPRADQWKSLQVASLYSPNFQHKRRLTHCFKAAQASPRQP